MDVTPDYSREWRVYARRQRLAMILLIGWGPAAIVLFAPSRWLHISVIAFVLMGLWGALAYAAVWWAGEFRCPRCFRRAGALGQHKGPRLLLRGLFDTECSNCKLRRWENG